MNIRTAAWNSGSARILAIAAASYGSCGSLFISVPLAELHEGVACVHAIFLQVTPHEGTRPDDTASSNDGTVQDYDVCADPYVVLDDDAAFAGFESMPDDGPVPRLVGVVDRCQGAIRCDRHALADQHTVARVDDSARVYVAAFANRQVAVPARRLDLYECVYDDSRFQRDFRSPDRVFDIAQRRYFCVLRDDQHRTSHPQESSFARIPPRDQGPLAHAQQFGCGKPDALYFERHQAIADFSAAATIQSA